MDNLVEVEPNRGEAHCGGLGLAVARPDIIDSLLSSPKERILAPGHLVDPLPLLERQGLV